MTLITSSSAAPYSSLHELPSPLLECSIQDSGYLSENNQTQSSRLSGKSTPSSHDTVVPNYDHFINPCLLSWHDLSYVVPCPTSATNRHGHQTILDKVSGRSAPGDLTAIIGPSGSGKTTLVDLLADRISSGVVTGTIALNGVTRNTKTLRAVSSYVAQEDSLLGSFTVVETMRMAAKLSLPHSMVMTDIHTRVENVIAAMGLGSCRTTLVGDVFRKGLSGGQKRRLSIGVALLSNPSIVLLDEPTSGLDSCSAHHVMKHIARLSRDGKNVVCTIHQPSSFVYNLFTNVIVLARGQTVYSGPCSSLLPHFASSGFPCPSYVNIAEFVVNLVNTDFEHHVDVWKLVLAYEEGIVKQQLVDQLAVDRETFKNVLEIELQASSAMRQFQVLLYRNTLNNLRNPGIYWIRVLMYFFLSFMVGTMYLSSNHELTEEDLVPMLFYVQAFLVFMSVAVLPFFIEQRAVFARERANSSLSVVSYVCANFLAALPGIFVIAVMSTCLVVWLANLQAFEYFLLNLFLSLVVAESMMHVIGAAAPHYITGIAVGAGIFGMFMLCEGFMVPSSSIPTFWKWGYYIAFHTYSFESFVFKQFEHSTSESGKAILIKYGMEHVDVMQNMSYLVAFVAGFEVLFMAILWKFHTGRR